MCMIVQIQPSVTVPIVQLLERRGFQPVFPGHHLSSDGWPKTRTIEIDTWAQQVRLCRMVLTEGGATDTWVRISETPAVDVLGHPDVRSSKMMKAKEAFDGNWNVSHTYTTLGAP